MNVVIPPALRDYTGGQAQVVASGARLADLFADLERCYPGMRFRMVDEQDALRPHIRVFINGAAVRGLDTPLRATDEVMIVQALSGG